MNLPTTKARSYFLEILLKSIFIRKYIRIRWMQKFAKTTPTEPGQKQGVIHASTQIFMYFLIEMDFSHEESYLWEKSQCRCQKCILLQTKAIIFAQIIETPFLKECVKPWENIAGHILKSLPHIFPRIDISWVLT